MDDNSMVNYYLFLFNDYLLFTIKIENKAEAEVAFDPVIGNSFISYLSFNLSSSLPH